MFLQFFLSVEWLAVMQWQHTGADWHSLYKTANNYVKSWLDSFDSIKEWFNNKIQNVVYFLFVGSGVFKCLNLNVGPDK